MRVKRNFDTILIILLALAIVAGAALSIWGPPPPGESNKENTATLEPLPSAYFYAPDGSQATLEDFRGRVVLVNLWATWCPPCVAELASLDTLQARLGGMDFVVVAISQDRTSAESVAAFLKKRDITRLEPYWDKDRQIPLKWRYAGLPVSFLIDRDGTLIEQFDGPREWDSPEMIARVSAALR